MHEKKAHKKCVNLCWYAALSGRGVQWGTLANAIVD